MCVCVCVCVCMCVCVCVMQAFFSSLQQFVKDTGGFVSEMAQALLNGLTGGRHRKLLENMEFKEGKEQVSSKRGSVVSEQVEGDGGSGAKSTGELLEVVGHKSRNVCDGIPSFMVSYHGWPPTQNADVLCMLRVTRL